MQTSTGAAQLDLSRRLLLPYGRVDAGERIGDQALVTDAAGAGQSLFVQSSSGGAGAEPIGWAVQRETPTAQAAGV